MLLKMALFRSFLWLSTILVCVCVCVRVCVCVCVHAHACHIFLIHLSANEHLGSFHISAIVNSAVMNIMVHVSFWILVFSGYAQKWDCRIIW